MRVLGLVLLGLACAAPAFALEAAAGADTVNSSQVGINAKIDATNAMTTTAINQITACGKDGKVYDALHNVCVTLTETDPVATPLINKIFACGNGNKVAHSDGSCSGAVPPDLTNSLNTTNTNLGNATALLNKVVACNATKQFYDPSTGGCSSAGTSFTFSTFDITNTNGNVTGGQTDIGWHRFCASAGQGYGAPSGGRQQIWISGGANTGGQYHWFGLNAKSQKNWTPDFYVICGD